MICDIGRKKAVIHERGRKWLLAELSSDEMERLQREGTEENWAKLWKTFLQRSLLKREKIQTAREITCLYGSGIL